MGVCRYISGVRIASDLNLGLITLFKAAQNGWVPPVDISKDQYNQIKAKNDLNDPITAWAACTCSFGALWFDSFIDIKERAAQLNNFIKESVLIKSVQSQHCDYLNYTPIDQLIYCDPPYINTVGYKVNNDIFDHDRFWDVMREWSKHNTVIVSEYVAPDDFTCIAEFKSNTQVQGHNYNRPIKTEKLFKLIPKEEPLFIWD